MNLIAALTMQSAFDAVIVILVAGLVFYLIHWLIGYVGVPEPFNKIAKIILAVAAVVVLIRLILSLVPNSW